MALEWGRSSSPKVKWIFLPEEEERDVEQANSASICHRERNNLT